MRCFAGPLFLFLALTIAFPAGVAAVILRELGAPRVLSDRTLRLAIWALGPVGTKLAQYLSMRPDLFSATMIDAMRRSQSRAHVVSDASTRRLLSARLGKRWVDRSFRVLGSGSLCQVVLPERAGANGAEAIKFLKPKVSQKLRAFLWAVGGTVRLMAATGQPPHVPIDRIWAQFHQSLSDQLDLTIEQETTARVKRQFALETGVRIPSSRVVEGANDVLVLEHLSGLCPVDETPSADRTQALTLLTRAVYKMIFDTGLVHIDLHPGNVYWRGESRQVVLLDFGMVARLSMSVREDFKRFFAAFVHNQGSDAARVVLRMADHVPDTLDMLAFEARMIDFINRHSARVAQEFSVAAFISELLDIQRDFGVVGNTDVVRAMLALLQLETITLKLDPDFQFQAIARDFIGLSRYDFAS